MYIIYIKRLNIDRKSAKRKYPPKQTERDRGKMALVEGFVAEIAKIKNNNKKKTGMSDNIWVWIEK